MSDNKEYSKWTLEELVAEEKKMKRNQTIHAFMIGFLISVMVYGVAKNGFGFLYIFVPLILISGVIKQSQKLKENLKEIEASKRPKGENKK